MDNVLNNSVLLPPPPLALLERRRDLMNKKKDAAIPLPEGYTLGEYFNVTESTWVALTVAVPRTVEALVEPNVNMSHYMQIAGRSGHFSMGVYGTKAAANSSNVSSDSYFEDGVPRLVVAIQRNNNSKYYVDGVDTGLTGTCGHSGLGIFGDYSQWTTNPFYGKVYYIKISKNGSLVHYLVPCKDINGNGKMYDVVNSKFVSPSRGTLHVI